ncbi:GGDEF domain-containing protein [Angustibacter aerolatus]
MPRTDDASSLRSLAAMARALGRSERLLAMVELAAEEACVAMDAASVSISRVEPGIGSVRTLINAGDLGPDEERWPTDEVYPVEAYAQLEAVVHDGRTLITSVTDPAAPAEELRILHALGKGSALQAAIAVDGQLWGEFYATRHVGVEAFSEQESAYAETLVAILGGAVSRALHVETLERLAFVDPLTGLANRRALDDATAQAFAALAGRRGRRITVVAMDLNGLKQVNDRGGHELGDQLIRSTAGLLSSHFATLPGSLVARTGGDEFVALVPGHGRTRVHATASAACSAVHELPLGEGLSCGIATTTGDLPVALDAAAQLFRAADAELYRAKQRGDRVPLPAVTPS